MKKQTAGRLRCPHCDGELPEFYEFNYLLYELSQQKDNLSDLLKELSNSDDLLKDLKFEPLSFDSEQLTQDNN